MGQTEKCLKALIDIAGKEGGIIFLDEVDSILAGDSSIEKSAQSSFKQLIQPGQKGQPVVTAATNRPWDITDEAVQRRFELKLYISLPTPGERRWYLGQILAKRLCDTCTGKPLDLEKLFDAGQWRFILENTRGFTPFDLTGLLRVARSTNDVSVNNIEDVVFVKSAIYPGKFEARAKDDGILNYYTIDGKRGGIKLPDVDHKNICWPMVRFEDLQKVLKEGWVRTSVSVKSLAEFKDYAQSVKDTESIPEIERTIREIGGGDIDYEEVSRYMSMMTMEKMDELKRLEEKCRLQLV